MMQTFEPIKLNNRYAFPEELDMSSVMTAPADDSGIYMYIDGWIDR
jgi:hypothetical protein